MHVICRRLTVTYAHGGVARYMKSFYVPCIAYRGMRAFHMSAFVIYTL
jgi:hypothetical protein